MEETLLTKFKDLYPAYNVILSTKINDGTLYSDGISIIHIETGKEYSLLEAISYSNLSKREAIPTTSDIVVIFEVDKHGYKRLVNYYFGATEFENSIGYAIEMIEHDRAGIHVDLSAPIL